MTSLRHVSRKAGMSPGTLVHVGKKRAGDSRIAVIDYSEKDLSEKELKKPEDAFPFRDSKPVSWISVDGIHDVKAIEKIGAHFRIHPLVLEDVLNTGQRPKAEVHDRYLFAVLKMLTYDDDTGKINTEQVSFVIGRNYVISFHENEGDIFGSVRERIRKSRGRIRKKGSDYLAYALIDSVVDNYFIVMEKFEDSIEELEQELLSNPTPETLQEIHSLKRELIMLRKSVWPLREVLSRLARGDTRLIRGDTIPFLRDVYDHTIQIIDTIESLKDTASGMLDTYLSTMSNRMNEVMKVLTIIATIFIPLTFIAGIYGMNFGYMPELGWEYGYFAVLGVMAAIFLVMMLFFRRKGWL